MRKRTLSVLLTMSLLAAAVPAGLVFAEETEDLYEAPAALAEGEEEADVLLDDGGLTAEEEAPLEDLEQEIIPEQEIVPEQADEAEEAQEAENELLTSTAPEVGEMISHTYYRVIDDGLKGWEKFPNEYYTSWVLSEILQGISVDYVEATSTFDPYDPEVEEIYTEKNLHIDFHGKKKVTDEYGNVFEIKFEYQGSAYGDIPDDAETILMAPAAAKLYLNGEYTYNDFYFLPKYSAGQMVERATKVKSGPTYTIKGNGEYTYFLVDSATAWVDAYSSGMSDGSTVALYKLDGSDYPEDLRLGDGWGETHEALDPDYQYIYEYYNPNKAGSIRYELGKKVQNVELETKSIRDTAAYADTLNLKFRVTYANGKTETNSEAVYFKNIYTLRGHFADGTDFEADLRENGSKIAFPYNATQRTTQAGKTMNLYVRVYGKEGFLDDLTYHTVYQGDVALDVVKHTHTLGEWKVTKAATTTAEGEKTATCKDCGETVTEKIPKIVNPTPAVTMNKKTATIYTAGTKTVTLKGTLKNAKGTVKYATSNKKVATVSSKGVVTAKKAGTVTITASVKVGNKTYKATCKVTVKKNACKLTKTELTMYVGETAEIRLTGKKKATEYLSQVYTVKENGYDDYFAIEHFGSLDQLGYMEKSAQWLMQFK